MRQAELWRALARQQLARGAPPEIAENALLASILAFGDVGQWAHVGAIYRELSKLDLDPSRSAHYERVSGRYTRMADEPLEILELAVATRCGKTRTSPRSGTSTSSSGSSAGARPRRAPTSSSTSAGRISSGARPCWRVSPRSPLDQNPDDASPPALESRLRLAEQLAQLQLYAVLSPLERLFARPEGRVKVAVLQSLQTLFFKRSFVTVRAALRDPDPAVVEQACKAVETLYFPHAVDPLSRILRESPDPAPRASALRALARIDTLEAADILLGVLEHGAPADRLAALAALKATRGLKFAELAKGSLQNAKDPLRATLVEVLSARGLAA